MKELPPRALRPVSLPATVALWPLRNAALFPGSFIPIDTERVSPWQWFRHTVLRHDQIVVVATRRDPSALTSHVADVLPIGCAARIIESRRVQRGIRRVVVQGVCRARIVEELPTTTRFAGQPSPYVRIGELVDSDDYLVNPALERLKQLARRLLRSSDALSVMDGAQHGGQLADLIAAYAELDPLRQQAILETLDVRERVARVIEALESPSAAYR